MPSRARRNGRSPVICSPPNAISPAFSVVCPSTDASSVVTTLLASVLGHTTLNAGEIAFGGEQITGLRPFRRARLGIGYVPQEREIFPSLDVEENLAVAARPARGGGWTLERVYALFPRL